MTQKTKRAGSSPARISIFLDASLPRRLPVFAFPQCPMPDAQCLFFSTLPQTPAHTP
jgi:hypothetical protein